MDSTMFFNRDVDKAFQRAAGRFLRATKQVCSLDALTLTIGSATLPAFPTGFLPELVIDSYLTLSGFLISPYIGITTIESVLQAQLNGQPWLNGYLNAANPPTSPPTGCPSLIGFSTTTAGIVNTLPDQAYTLNLFWWKKLETFTAGCMGAWSSATAYQPGDVVSSAGTLYQAIISNTNVAVGTTSTWTNLGAGTVDTPGTLTFALPDESIDIITQWGIPAYLQMSTPDKLPQSRLFMKEFDAEIRRIAARGAGGRSPRMLIKPCPTDANGNWISGGYPQYGCQ